MRTNSFAVSTTVLTAMALAASLLLLLLWPASPAPAQAVIAVNTAADEQNTNQKCSLREAIANANANAKTSPDCGAGNGEDAIIFRLGKSAKITLGSALPGITDAAGLTIDGREAKITVSGDNAVRVFDVASTGKFTLRNLRVADGFRPVGLDADNGGGIRNFGTLKVTNSTFSGNAGNEGGGISNQGTQGVGTAKVTNSTFSENNAGVQGGGIYNDDDATLTVINSTFFQNSANEGGGLTNENSTVEVINSTFSQNSATSGGNLFNDEEVGEVAVATLKSTIVADSASGGNCGANPVTELFIDGGFNIADDASCAFSDPTSKNNTAPRFAGGLANNGGPTKTIALRPKSPAIDAIPAGDNGCGTEITEDQRGVQRPQNKACDIGAYELRKGKKK